ncbi:MAG: tetratricopeptide repeat protein, partial [Thermodesulfobacteriota bacterium]
LLVFLLAYRLIGTANPDKDNTEININAFVAASVTALFFALHPLRVESVVWVSERKDVLYTFFYLLGLLSYLKYATVDSGKTKFYILTLFFAACSLMSKVTAVSFPLVLIILDYYPLERPRGKVKKIKLKNLLIEKVPFFIIAFGAGLINILINKSKTGYVPGTDFAPLIDRVFVSFRNYIYYIYKMIVPTDLAPYYPFPKIIPLLSLEYLGSIILVLIFSVGSIVLIKKYKFLSAAWFFYLVTLTPAVGILQGWSYLAADRYTYLPGLAPTLLVGLLAGTTFTRPARKGLKVATVAATLAVLVIFIALTVRQTGVWKDDITFWSHEIKLYPDTVDMAYMNRAISYIRDGETSKALNDFRRAIEINPNKPATYINRAKLRKKINDINGAISDYTRAIELDPAFSKSYAARANLYGRAGKIRKAIDDLSKAIEIDSTDPNTFYNRAFAYKELGIFDKAISDYTSTIKLNPKDTDALYGRAGVYAVNGEPKKAIADYSKAAELEPDFAEAYYEAARIYKKLGNKEEALSSFKKAASLGHPGAKKELNK